MILLSGTFNAPAVMSALYRISATSEITRWPFPEQARAEQGQSHARSVPVFRKIFP